jgi:hypothetical protein
MEISSELRLRYENPAVTVLALGKYIYCQHVWEWRALLLLA